VKLQTLNSTERSETSDNLKKKDLIQSSLEASKSLGWQSETKQTQSIQSHKPDAVTIDPNINDHTNNTNTNSSNNSVITPSNEEIARFLANLARLPSCKPSFKLIMADLSAELVDQNLVLQTSTQTYQAGLQNPEIQIWLSDQFSSQFGFRPTKILVQLNKSGKPEPTSTQPTSDNNCSKATDGKNLSNQEVSHSSKKTFYKIYRQLPEGVDPKVVEVLPGPILLPNQKPGFDDNHLDGIFEFE
jgi:hypothetical protein